MSALVPYVPDAVRGFVTVAGIIGQLSLGIWLLVKGGNTERWNQMGWRRT